MRFPTFSLWKKINPDAIWLGPGLILMPVQSFIFRRDYVGRDAEWLVLYFVTGLLLTGGAISFFKPIQKRLDKGAISESVVSKYKKVYLFIMTLVVVLHIASIISHVIR